MRSPPTDNDAIALMHSSSSEYHEGVDSTDSSSDDRAATPDLKGVILHPEEPVRQPRSAEKIVMTTRRMHWLDANQDVKIDCDDSDLEAFGIDRDVANTLRRTVVNMTWVCYAKEEQSKTTYEGQGSFLRDGPEGTIMFLTANHNICSEYNKNGFWETCGEGHDCSVNGLETRVVIPNTGWAKTPQWEEENDYPLGDGILALTRWTCGVDISLGSDCTADDSCSQNWVDLRDSARKNDVVSDDFCYSKGMKIGMAAFTKNGPNNAKEVAKLSGVEPEQVHDILGGASEYTIFTGVITRVGKKHIEYDMNSHGGCSGAAIFCLEKENQDFLNVLAIHVGHKKNMVNNIGFKLAKVFSLSPDGIQQKPKVDIRKLEKL